MLRAVHAGLPVATAGMPAAVSAPSLLRRQIVRYRLCRRDAAAITRHVRRPAVVVDEVEAELGVVVLRQQVAQREAVLTSVARIVILRARRHQLAVGVHREDAGGVVLVVAAPVTGIRDDPVLADEIVGAEEDAAAVDLGLLPLGHPGRLERQIVGELLHGPHHRCRGQRFLQLGAGHAQLAHVDRVEHVDAVQNERALAPAHHLVADADEESAPADVELGVSVEVEQFGFLRLEIVFGRAGHAVLAGCGIVVEIRATGEQAEIAVLDHEVRRRLGCQRDKIAILVVEVAVVGVGVARSAAIGDGDQAGIAALHPPKSAE